MSGSAPRTTRKAVTNAPWKKLWKRSKKYARNGRTGETTSPASNRRPARRRRWSSISRISLAAFAAFRFRTPTETGLFWSPDSRKLAFTAVVEGKRGTYTVEIPDDLKPKLLTTQTGTQARWLKQSNQIVWLSNGLPASFPLGPASRRSELKTGETPVPPSGGYNFQALQRVDLSQRNRAAFDLCWRTMRDTWYDERLGNRDWPAIRRKYTDLAAASPRCRGVHHGRAVDARRVERLAPGFLYAGHQGLRPLRTSRPPTRRRRSGRRQPRISACVFWPTSRDRV